MPVQVVLTGLSHKTAPVALRERLALSGSAAHDVLRMLRSAVALDECALLSTCNRSEFYAVSSDPAWQEHLLEFLAEMGHVSPAHLQENLYYFEGMPAARHLMRVACGLDSMVVGESQILAQVKDAHQQSVAVASCGRTLHALFEHALAAGKRARSETEISRGAVSISLAAVRLARQIFGQLSGQKVLLIGAGETGEHTARALVQDGVRPQIMVSNRTPERAQALADQFGGVTVPFERIDDALVQADIVITSTGAPHAIIQRDPVCQALRARRGRPIFFIDIAVPRDVEPSVGEIDDVYLYNIDDLQAVVAKNLAGRKSEVQRVETIIEEETRRFQGWLRGREVGPTIAELQRHADTLVQAEWDRVGGRLAHLSDRDREAVETYVRGVVNKLLRPPILRLREAANSGNGYHEVDAVRTIFGLNGAADDATRPEEEPRS